MSKHVKIPDSWNRGFAPGAAAAVQAATAHAPAPQAAAPAPPPAPAPVAPFLSADDLSAINDFTTNYTTSLQNLDFELGNLQTDTNYQETQVNQGAKQQTATTADAMAARGLFRSSIKDAALYDIEANRALQTKFLDDKLTAATLNAGTQKNLLAQSKSRFDTATAQKQVENAQTANDAQNAGYQAQLEAFYGANPPQTPKAAAPQKVKVPKPPAAPKPPKAPKLPKNTARNVGGNRSQGTGRL